MIDVRMRQLRVWQDIGRERHLVPGTVVSLPDGVALDFLRAGVAERVVAPHEVREVAALPAPVEVKVRRGRRA